jgi:outer membrane protein TolC
MEIPPTSAVQIALKQRLDMRVALGEVYDAQRKIIVAANALQAGLTITGSARIGDGRTIYTTGQDNVKFRPERGLYQWGILLDLPLDRTVEQDLYRETFIDFHQSVRDAQQLEDEIKLEVRDALRNLIQFRESFRIQNKAVRLAEQRVKSTQLFLQLGLQGTQIRDVLEAQEALVSAQNARTAALVNYRLAELQLQRDMGVLSIGNDGLWREWNPPDGPAVK